MWHLIHNRRSIPMTTTTTTTADADMGSIMDTTPGIEDFTLDRDAGCWRKGPVDLGNNIVQHQAVCCNGTCRSLFSLMFERISGEAREDIQIDHKCKTAHQCRNRILGPLSDFKPHLRQ